MLTNRVTLDPNQLDRTAAQLITVFNLPGEAAATLREVVALYPRAVDLLLDEANAVLFDNPLADKFTFDLEADELIMFSHEFDTLLDGLIEMAMYLAGFATLIGNQDEWVIEFAIGAWKPVKKQVKRRLGLQTSDQPRYIVGLPAPPSKAPPGDRYPFRTLVSSYDAASFHTMIMLAAREDVEVYFPPDTHVQVRAAYEYARRAMHGVASNITLSDYAQFNTNLLNEVRRIEHLFHPAQLGLPPAKPPARVDDLADHIGIFPPRSSVRAHNPFESFIENHLFGDDDPSRDDEPPHPV